MLRKRQKTYSIAPKEEPQRWLAFAGEASTAPARATAADCSSERPVYRGASDQDELLRGSPPMGSPPGGSPVRAAPPSDIPPRGVAAAIGFDWGEESDV
jgi:hypothetical protein